MHPGLLISGSLLTIGGIAVLAWLALLWWQDAAAERARRRRGHRGHRGVGPDGARRLGRAVTAHAGQVPAAMPGHELTRQLSNRGWLPTAPASARLRRVQLELARRLREAGVPCHLTGPAAGRLA